MLRGIAAGTLLWAGLATPARPDDRPPSLSESLAKESPADLARAAVERGDAARGAVLFFQPFLQCARCHDGETATPLGPDLARLGKEATAESLVESVLHPSKVIRPGYESVVLSTLDGRTLAGRIAEEKDGRVTLIDPAAGGAGWSWPRRRSRPAPSPRPR